MDSELAELAELAAKARKALHWAAFLIIIMTLIMIIDLQLKKSIGEIAVEVARGRGQAPHQAGNPPAVGDGGDGVVGTTGVAKGGIQGDGPGEDAKSPGVDGPPKRTRGDGRRTGGPR